MEAKLRLHSGETTWMTAAPSSEGPTTLKEGAAMKTKPAGKARKSMSRKGAKTSARTPATPRGARTRDPRLPAAGTVLQRTYKGRELRVEVLDEGFRWDGNEFRSLTAVALAITGYPACSGPHFFGLDRPATTPTETTPTTA